MKNIIIALLTIFAVGACKKDKTADNDKEPVGKELELQRSVSVGVEGFVFGENAEPVANAKVVAGATTVYTNQHGFFSIKKAMVPEIAGSVKISHDNYFTTVSTFSTAPDDVISLSVRLTANAMAGNFEAADGGAVALENGTRLVFAPASIVRASGGVYNGTVEVSILLVDPADPESSTQVPGNRIGINTDGVLRYTESYGVLGVQLKSNSGERLQVASDHKVQVIIPISPDWLEKAPGQTGLWSLNEEYGLWQEEGVLVKSGNNYAGEVSHFSFWQAAEGADLVRFKATIVDASNTPVGGAGVSINYNGSVNSAAAGYGRTDNDGFVSGYIPANKELSLRVGGGWAICADGSVVKTFTTSGEDIDLGTVTGSVEQWMITLSGVLLNCDNNPVQEGYVYTFGKGFYHKIPVMNGVFSFSGLVCAHTSVSIVGVDITTGQQSEPLQLTLSPGATELEVQACAAPATTHLTVTIDGEDFYKKEETNLLHQILGIYTLNADETSGWTNVIVFDNNWRPVGGSVYFILAGLNNADVQGINEVFLTNDQRLYSEIPVAVNITSYGKVGGFIEGSFEGLMYDWENGITGTILRQVTCSFKIRRII